MTHPQISVCIVSSRPGLLDMCLESLQQQDHPPDFEVLVSSDGDAEVAAVAHRRFPGTTVGYVRNALPASARNYDMERAHGDVLLFLDDDVVVPPDLLDRLQRLAISMPEVAVFGGPNLTPPDSGRFQTVQGEVLASSIATGPVRHRYSANRPHQADQRHFMTCNLAVRRASMRPFSGQLICAEENGVLAEMSRAGVHMHYDPGFFVYHRRRPDYRSFVRQMFTYGRGRGQLIAQRPSSLLPAALVPAFLVAGLSVLPALAFIDRRLIWFLVGYLALAFLGAFGVCRRLGRMSLAVLAVILIVTLHLCYGFGIWLGIVEGLRRSQMLDHDWAPVGGSDADLT